MNKAQWALLVANIILIVSMVNGFVHASKVGFTGDVDCNANQNKDFKAMKDLGVVTVVIAGDYAYKDGNCVLNYLKDNGYSSANTILADGNHDKCADIKKFTTEAKCYYHKTIGNVEYYVLDIEAGMKATDIQYKDVSTWIKNSNAPYKVVVVHEPFVTAKSTHAVNGFFKDWQALLNSVSLVDQAHNHNYQRFLINNVTYLVTGTGHHDEGAALYDIKSQVDPYGNKLLKGIDNKNGFAIVDFTTDGIAGSYYGSDGNYIDRFGQNITTPPVENGTIDTNPNEVCVCKNDTTIPPVEKIAQNVTVNIIHNATDIGNYTKIYTNREQIALIPLVNNTDIKILAELREPE